MSHFKSQQEIWEYLIAGGKVIRKANPPDIHCFVNGNLCFYRTGNPSYLSFDFPSAWLPYTEPKKKSFELHEAVVDYGEGDFILRWVSNTFRTTAKIYFTGRTKVVEAEE